MRGRHVARADLRHRRARLRRRLGRDAVRSGRGGVGRRAGARSETRRGGALVEVELVVARGIRNLAPTPERVGASRGFRADARSGSGAGARAAFPPGLGFDARVGARGEERVRRRSRRGDSPRGVDSKHLAEHRERFVRHATSSERLFESAKALRRRAARYLAPGVDDRSRQRRVGVLADELGDFAQHVPRPPPRNSARPSRHSPITHPAAHTSRAKTASA